MEENIMQSNIPQFQEIQSFVNGLKFRKAMYGANTEDVLACIQDLNAMYTDALAKQQQEQSAAEGALKERLAVKESQIAALTAELETLRQGRPDADAPYEMKAPWMIGEDTGEEEKDILVQALSEMKKNMEATGEQAERDARAVIAQAKIEAGELIDEARRQIRAEREQEQAFLMEVEKLRLRAKQVLDFTYNDFSGIAQEVGSLRERIENIPPMGARAEESNDMLSLRKVEGYAAAK